MAELRLDGFEPSQCVPSIAVDTILCSVEIGDLAVAVWCSGKFLLVRSFAGDVVHTVPSAADFEMPVVALVDIPVAADTIVELVDTGSLAEAVHTDKTGGGRNLMNHLKRHRHFVSFAFDPFRGEIGIDHLAIMVVVSVFVQVCA